MYGLRDGRRFVPILARPLERHRVLPGVQPHMRPRAEIVEGHVLGPPTKSGAYRRCSCGRLFGDAFGEGWQRVLARHLQEIERDRLDKLWEEHAPKYESVRDPRTELKHEIVMIRWEQPRWKDGSPVYAVEHWETRCGVQSWPMPYEWFIPSEEKPNCPYCAYRASVDREAQRRAYLAISRALNVPDTRPVWEKP
jgi:hypothetical protein